MIRANLTAAVAAFFLLGVAVENLHAQGRTTTGGGTTSSIGSTSTGSLGSSSSFGSTGLGSTGSLGSSSLGSSGMGSTGFGSSSSSGFGSTGFGSTGVGTTGTGLQSGYSAFSQQSGYSSVGQGTTGQVGQTRGASTTGLNGRNGLNGQTGLGQTSQTVRNTLPQVPVRLQVAFAVPHPTAAALTSTVQARLQAATTARNLGSAQVAIDPAGVTVLTGTAPSQHDRQVIEQIVSMQPGVATIRNEITIASDQESNQ